LTGPLSEIVAEEALFALDFDGTLAGIVERPPEARLVDGADETLRALAGAGAQIALVTGRDAVDVLELTGLADLAGLTVKGLHGAQTWRAGTLSSPAEPAGLATLRNQVRQLVSSTPSSDIGDLWIEDLWIEDLWIEDKPLSMVVHAPRDLNTAPAQLDRVRRPLAELAAAAGMQVLPGRNVLEVRLPGFDKGRAVRELANSSPRRAVVYAGDDLGDVAAFDAIRELRAAGRSACSIAVVSSEVDGLQDHADLGVDGPQGLIALLRSLLRH